MSGLEIFLIIFGILIFIGIMIVIILAIAGFFVEKSISKLLDGTFSFSPANDKSKFVTSSGLTTKPKKGDTLVLSSSSTVSCEDYAWTFKDNFLELGTTGLVATAPSPTTSTTPVSTTPVTTSTTTTPVSTTPVSTTPTPVPTTGTAITLEDKGSVNDRNQWVFNDLGFTWCLKSNNKLCMFNKSDTLTLENESISEGFVWILGDAIKSPTCS